MTKRNLHDLRHDYSITPLDPSTFDRDPIVQFERWFTEAHAADIMEPNAMTVATVDGEGQPHARQVLLKEVRPTGFVFFTNFHSAKGEQMRAHPKVALLFYWDRLERQVRVTGSAEKVDDATSDEYFWSRPLKSQIAAAASPQSQVLADRDALLQQFEALEREYADQEKIPRPENWGGYLVRPSTFEFWQGGSARLHDRLVYQPTDDGWRIERLAP